MLGLAIYETQRGLPALILQSNNPCTFLAAIDRGVISGKKELLTLCEKVVRGQILDFRLSDGRARINDIIRTDEPVARYNLASGLTLSRLPDEVLSEILGAYDLSKLINEACLIPRYLDLNGIAGGVYELSAGWSYSPVVSGHYRVCSRDGSKAYTLRQAIDMGIVKLEGESK